MTDELLTRHAERFLAALVYPLTTGRRAAVATVGAVLTYVVLVLSAFPGYTVQMLETSLAYADDAVLALTANTYASTGWVGVGLMVAYSMLTGVALVVAGTQLRTQRRAGAGGLTSLVPALVASGCASCGTGVLGLLGFAGAVAILPFEGNLLRLGGILLLVGYLARTGDPRTCAVPSADG
ncbi:hypothetical protein ACFR9U_07530 [Halorientalis brevis]|uniref:Uncharacterized protein n=1 Tax=Halorientalis brevis TaxID=1126241 RepID=A0ABD6CAC1_9EURY|nr:hypothetical protein [Halorientalis brevis]